MKGKIKELFEVAAGLVVLAVIFYAVFSFIDLGSEPEELLDMPVSDFKGKSAANNERLELIKQRLKTSGISLNAADLFYNCLSHRMYQSGDNILLKEPLDWCEDEFIREGKFTHQYFNLDGINRQFSGWDGAHKNLEKHIKNNLNDEESYKHIQTLYHTVLEGDNAPYIKVSTDFSAKNDYGGTIKSRVTARVDITTGEILEVSHLE